MDISEVLLGVLKNHRAAQACVKSTSRFVAVENLEKKKLGLLI